ncbi:GNAT family N-acetyltransferase [Paracoccus pacificus]|uniref:GNAT family N-acetyltransferase n=1 Tax=Paracoccus pacificus TaxID=1463598 RepID=A0ABW4R994_9RHOB
MSISNTIVIARESPLGADLALLHRRHTQDMHAETPPESIHMLDAGQLADPDIAFFVLREDGHPVGMGAVKRLDAGHGEIKSMHILTEARGRGYARRIVEHLLAHARAEGMGRLSLETGSEPIFEPARQLYLRAGFQECGPFAGYVEDPNSVFMTRAL